MTAHSGSVNGFTQLADGFVILEGLELARKRNEHATGIDWSALDRHVIDKGDLQIFPLARAGSDDESRDRFRAAVRELYTHAIHAFGGDSVHAEHRLTPDAGYGKTLATAGIVSEDALYMWRIGSYGAVPVVTSDPATGTTVLAIHVVPAEWEWTPWGSTDTARGASRARTMAKRCAAAEPHWEWPA